MDLDNILPYIIGLVIVIVAGSFLYKVVRHGGFKSAIFGARIQRTVGEVTGVPQAIGTTLLRVHVLAGRDDAADAVGLELVAKAPVSYQMLPLSLTRTEARKLILLLQSAMET